MDIHGYLRAHPNASADLVKALLRAESLEAPPGAVKAFMQQKTMAGKRGIAFEFNFADWWGFWAKDDRWSRRGRTKISFVMARFGDVGPYAPPWNVYCATPAGNAADRIGKQNIRRNTLPKRQKRIARPVNTPYGIFESTVAASKRFGITADAAGKRAKFCTQGWVVHREWST